MSEENSDFSKRDIKVYNALFLLGLIGTPLLALFSGMAKQGSWSEVVGLAGVFVFMCVAAWSWWSLWRAGDIEIGRQ